MRVGGDAMSQLPPYPRFRMDAKPLILPPHGNTLTFTPAGFQQSLNVKFPESRLAVCEKCKKNFKTKDMCRIRNSHTAPPWTTAYVCITIDESCTDEDGKFIDKPMSLRMERKGRYEVRKPFHHKTPVCDSCKRTNRTRSFCREKHKHRQLPWCTVYVLLSAQDQEGPTPATTGSSKSVEVEGQRKTPSPSHKGEGSEVHTEVGNDSKVEAAELGKAHDSNVEGNSKDSANDPKAENVEVKVGERDSADDSKVEGVNKYSDTSSMLEGINKNPTNGLRVEGVNKNHTNGSKAEGVNKDRANDAKLEGIVKAPANSSKVEAISQDAANNSKADGNTSHESYVEGTNKDSTDDSGNKASAADVKIEATNQNSLNVSFDKESGNDFKIEVVQEESANGTKVEVLSKVLEQNEIAIQRKKGSGSSDTINSDPEDTDDIHDIPESRTFLAKVNSRGTSIHWLNHVEVDENTASSYGSPDGVNVFPTATLTPHNSSTTQAQYFAQAHYAAQQHQDALKSQQQFYFHMQQRQQQYAQWHHQFFQHMPQGGMSAHDQTSLSRPAGEAPEATSNQNSQRNSEGTGSPTAAVVSSTPDSGAQQQQQPQPVWPLYYTAPAVGYYSPPMAQVVNVPTQEYQNQDPFQPVPGVAAYHRNQDRLEDEPDPKRHRSI